MVDEDDAPYPAPDGEAARDGQRDKDSRDTARGCRERAAADEAEAGTMDTAHGRQRLARSAASWTSRAQLLQRLEDKAQARQAGSSDQADPL